jgi:3-hydroxyisobutyrate dehydrogenase-like beta-hydroxyacid dehydrogenase
MAVRRTRGTVGVIGLGIMGGAFARNLVTAGWRVVGYDPNPARRREARRAGVDLANNAAEVASAVPIILTSLPKPQALTETVQEIAAAKLRSKVVVEMSTFTISDKEKAARTLHKAGHVMIDCPVSGTGSQAKNRDLVFYASGNARTIARLRPVLMAFGRNVFNVGEFGNGSRMKYVANLLVAINNVAAAEAMVLGMKAGLDPDMIVDLVRAGAGNSRVFELRAPMMAKGRYDDVTMKISVWDKDMQVIGDYARKIRVPTPIFNATKGIYLKAMKSGLGSRDTAAVCAVLEKMAKVKRKKPRAR